MEVSGLDPRLNTCIDFVQQLLPEAGITFHCESLQPRNCANTGPLPPPPPPTHNLNSHSNKIETRQSSWWFGNCMGPPLHILYICYRGGPEKVRSFDFTNVHKVHDKTVNCLKSPVGVTKTDMHVILSYADINGNFQGQGIHYSYTRNSTQRGIYKHCIHTSILYCTFYVRILILLAELDLMVLSLQNQRKIIILLEMFYRTTECANLFI
jgi:hypothetical protein